MSVANNNLFSQRDLIKARIESEKNQLKDVEEKIKKMYLPVGKEQLGFQKKDFGTTTVKLPQGEAKVTISKKVNWDQKKLVEIGNKLPPEVANTLIKYVVKVDETVYKNLDDSYKELFIEARTVEEGTITIVEVKEN
tara:strand:+ start:144 stop:554 length:411 start_codon:yes stop_codon:yes gene_type:complete